MTAVQMALTTQQNSYELRHESVHGETFYPFFFLLIETQNKMKNSTCANNYY